MSVLSKDEILRRIQLSIEENESIVITPRIDKELDHDAIDLTLGSYFRIPSLTTTECIKPYKDKNQKIKDHYPELIHKPCGRGDSLILQPRHTVLASTLEYIKVPGDLSGQILTKSSWARIFISIASAPWIHPFYRGCLTLEICNLGNVPIALPIGKPIAQLVFLKVHGESVKNRDDIVEGIYAGAVMPEAPMFGS